MALAETARLIASLELKDNLSKGVASATAGVGRLESKVGGLQGRVGKLSGNLRGGASSALSTFSGRLKNVATATAGLLGIGGLFAVSKAFNDSIQKAREFGDASIRMAQLTGQSVDQASRLVDALDYFGIAGDKATKVAGMFQKNIGNIAMRSKDGAKWVAKYNETHDKNLTLTESLAKIYPKAVKFQKDYGLSLFDSQGKLNSYNEQLKVSADFYNNKTIPVSKRVAALQKLYGKSWQDLLPLLSKGRAGIDKALGEAMHLSQADLDAITKNKEATRKWNDAIGDLQVKIGIGLLPTVTELVKTLTDFVDTHGNEIQDFFKNAVTTGKKFGGAALDAVRGIKAVWDGIPNPIKDLLIKGVVADRTVKFLFGFSITDLAKPLLGGLLGGLGKGLFARGATPANPMWVQQVGGLGGGVGGAAGAGAAYTFGTVLGNVMKVVGVIAIAELADQLRPAIMDLGTSIHDSLGLPKLDFHPSDLQWPFGPKNAPDWANFSGVTPGMNKGSFSRSATQDHFQSATPWLKKIAANTEPHKNKPSGTTDHFQTATPWLKQIAKNTTPKTDPAHPRIDREWSSDRMRWKPSGTVQVEDRRGEVRLSELTLSFRATKAAQQAASDRLIGVTNTVSNRLISVTSAKLAAVNSSVLSNKAAAIAAADRTTRAVNAIPPPRLTTVVHTHTVVNVSAAQYARTMVQNGTWSSSQAGAYNKGSRIPGT